MNSFENEQVDIDTLPDYTQLEFKKLRKAYLKVRLFYHSLFNLILVGLVAYYLIFKPFNLPQWLIYIILGFLIIRIIYSYTALIKGFNNKLYALREKDIIYKSGWLWQSTTIVPFNRVQHLQIDQGPIERKLKLSKLKVFTAGGQSSDLTIPGIEPDEAQAIKQFIVAKTAEDEEE